MANETTYPVDGIKAKHLTSKQGALDFVDEVVIPFQCAAVPHGNLIRWLRSIHLPVFDHHPDYTESVGDDGALRRAHNIDLLSKDKHNGADEEDLEYCQFFVR